MPRIRIIAVPPGQAPAEVRKEWVGAVIPLLPEQDLAGIEMGVLGGEPDPQNVGGYRVDTDEAICSITERNTPGAKRAAAWWIDWRENTWNGRTCCALIFSKDVCELIE